jgi:hypothetical protein
VQRLVNRNELANSGRQLGGGTMIFWTFRRELVDEQPVKIVVARNASFVIEIEILETAKWPVPSARLSACRTQHSLPRRLRRQLVERTSFSPRGGGCERSGICRTHVAWSCRDRCKSLKRKGNGCDKLQHGRGGRKRKKPPMPFLRER